MVKHRNILVTVVITLQRLNTPAHGHFCNSEDVNYNNLFSQTT